jgi:hypothetical protein
MESNRKVTKTVVKSGGRKKKSVTKIQKEEVSAPIAGPIERGIEDVVENGNTAPEMLGASLTTTWKHFISKDSHFALHNIPIHKMNDPHYIHFHIFSVWFLSNMNIPIPNDLELHFSQFLDFPFYSSLFHINNNLSLESDN